LAGAEASCYNATSLESAGEPGDIEIESGVTAMKSRQKQLWFFFVGLVFALPAGTVTAETLYVDGRIGSDENPGTGEKPVRTIRQAAAMVNGQTEKGPSTIKITPGVYNLDKSVVFENQRAYTEKDRLTIEASILPDDPEWKPTDMPAILSTEDPRQAGRGEGLTETYGIKIKMSHVTIRGLKFLGNPVANNWHCCVERVGEKLDDLIITQCMFVGDRDTLNVYCATLATGDRFVLDHNVFYNCHACVVFWDGMQGIPGRGNAMRHCIVNGAYISGVWTCQTAEDFEFHQNIITRSEHFWLRKRGDMQRYRVYDCIVTENKYYSGYGVASGATGQTGSEVTFEEKNVIKEGEIRLEKNKEARNYLHVPEGAFGSDLGAGLFKKRQRP
jgi:hypothetical protein